MRKLITLLLAWAPCCAAWADDLKENLKFGRPTMAEMELTEYALEPDAEALVLCALRDERYTFTDGGFCRTVDHKVRIKVLKAEGTDYANVSCLYRSSKTDNMTYRESISGISATAYNLEGGKTVATKMKAGLVFRERVNDDLMMVKFTIPQVKVGTVMEYAYTENSDDDLHIDDWYAQGDLPVLYTRFTLAVPECYVFSIDNTGAFPLEAKTSQDNMNISFGGGASTSLGTTTYSFVGRNIPSLHDDDHVWCIDDYRAKVAFEFERTVYPLDTKSYTSTWEEISELLMKDSDFGGRLSGSTPLKDEMASLRLDTLATVDEKVGAIYSLLMSRVEWNGDFALFGTKRASSVLKDGTGSNADLNFLLIGMLREAGIMAWPVVVRMRQNGRLPLSHPSLKKLDSFVVAYLREEAGDVDWGLVDASSSSGYIDVLQPRLMTDRGLLLTKNGASWIDLSARLAGREVVRIMAEVRPDGSIAGTRTNYYFQQESRIFKEKVKDTPVDEVVKNTAESLETLITDYTMGDDTQTFSGSASDAFAFERVQGSLPSSDDIIYVNPFVFSIWDANPFSDEHRVVPFERSTKKVKDYAVTLVLPEGYEVDELPSTLNVKNHDNSISCKVLFTEDDGVINVSYRYQVSRLTFLPDEYEQLRQIYDLICAKTNEMIALKKKS